MGKKLNQQAAKTRQAERFEREGRFRSGVSGENERHFSLSFSSEEPYTRYFGDEILDHGEGAVDLSRLNEIGCVLFNHDRDKVVGKVLSARIENGRGVAEIEFDEDEASEQICQKVRSGTLKGVSVSYRVTHWEEVSPGKTWVDGRFVGPCSVARKWTPLEISVVSVPADPTVGLGREDGESGMSVLLAEQYIQMNENYAKE